MYPTVQLALFGWVPVVILLFMTQPPRRAMLIAFIFGWMFLPVAGFKIPGLPAYTKVTATCWTVLLATAVFAPDRLLRFRPSALDLPALVWCLCPFASSMTNGLGAYDGVSAVVDSLFTWGLPYFLGRIYLSDFDGMRELAKWLLIGGLVYVPLCLFEVRMSPQLNVWVYGFGRVGVEYSEFGAFGSRPRVFMGTALTVGMFMTAASLIGVWMWRRGVIRRVGDLAAGPMVMVLVVTTVLCKNAGALALLMAGLGGLSAMRWPRTVLPVAVLIAVAPAYMFVRSTGRWSGETLVAMVQQVHERRAQSLEFRLDNEDILVAKALEQPVFGWGRWGRARVYQEGWRGDISDVSVTDGLWVIALGNTGLVGLSSLTAMILLPAAAFFWRCPRRLWLHPVVAPTLAVAVLTVLYMIDNLFNAMLNPIYVVAVGGVASVAALQPWRSAARRPASAQDTRPANAAFTRPPAPGWAPGASGSR